MPEEKENLQLKEHHRHEITEAMIQPGFFDQLDEWHTVDIKPTSPAKVEEEEYEQIEEYFQACRRQMHTADKGCAFHNWHHVADVTQCLYTVLLKTGLNNALTTEQLIAVFLAGTKF